LTWYNRKRIEEKYNVSDRGLMTASEIKEEFGIPIEVTASLFRPVEWHHTNVEGHYGGNPTDFYDSEEIKEVLNDPKNEKHEALLKAIAEDKEKRKFKEIYRKTGYFGYSDPDGSNSLWFKGTAVLVENGYGSRWWILPNGQRKREIEFISEKEFERKRNKFDYLHEKQIKEEEEQYKNNELKINQKAYSIANKLFEKARESRESVVNKQQIHEILKKEEISDAYYTEIFGKIVKHLNELGMKVSKTEKNNLVMV